MAKLTLQTRHWPVLLALLLVMFVGSSARAADSRPRLALKSNDRIIFIGNTFAERLALHGYFEALLASRFADLNLTFRSLAFSGDEALRGSLGSGAGPGGIGPIETNVLLQLRALNFGDIFSHIEQQKADVLFACYGMNESFAGPAGLPKFETDLRHFLSRLIDLKCGLNRSSPRVVLVSPIPHEDLGGDLPNPTRHNDSLKAYTEVMRKVAGDMNMPFVDLFGSVKPIMTEKGATPLTFNGVHLTRYGNWVVSQVMMEQLGLGQPSPTYEINGAKPTSLSLSSLPLPPPPAGSAAYQGPLLQNLPLFKAAGLAPGQYKLRINGRDLVEKSAAEWTQGVRLQPLAEPSESLVVAVDDKNQEFFMKYRAVNGEYIYGRRKSPFGVVNFPKEFEQLEQRVAEMDRAIHQRVRSPKSITVELVKTSP